MSEDNKLTVNLYRDGSLESSHEVNLYSNKKQYDDYFFPRSSVKPMQVIPLLLEASNQNIELFLKLNCKIFPFLFISNKTPKFLGLTMLNLFIRWSNILYFCNFWFIKEFFKTLRIDSTSGNSGI